MTFGWHSIQWYMALRPWVPLLKHLNIILKSKLESRVLFTAHFLQLLWNRNLRDNIMVAVELCPGKKKFVSATSGEKLFAFDQGEKK